MELLNTPAWMPTVALVGSLSSCTRDHLKFTETIKVCRNHLESAC